MVLLSLLLLGGCGEDERDPLTACIEDHAVEDGYTLDSDPELGDSIERVLTDCEEAGEVCSQEVLFSRDAALCIASLENLEEGVTDWTAGLSWSMALLRITWTVMSITAQAGDFSTGEELILDAETGEILGRSTWESNP